MRIDQIYYPPSYTGQHFKEKDNVYLNKILKEYYDDTLPCFFFSLFFSMDVLKNHKGLAIIIANSSLDIVIENYEYFKKRLNNKNLVFISTSFIMTKELKKLEFDSIEFPFMGTKYEKPLKKKGKNIYFYSCLNRVDSLSEYGYFRIKKILKKYFPHLRLICGMSVPQTEQPDIDDKFIKFTQSELYDVYTDCFLGIRLVKFDGLSDTVQTLGMLGINTIWNGGTPSGLSFDSDEDIIFHIKNEEQKIGTIDQNLSDTCKDFLDPNNYEYIFNSDTYDNYFNNIFKPPIIFKQDLPIITQNFYTNLYLFSIINYYIFSNNVINYEIISNDNILQININKILSKDGKLDFYMKIFGIRFNVEFDYLKRYSDKNIVGFLEIHSNLPIKLFNGVKWINYDVDNIVENNFVFEISKIHKWRIGIADYWLNDNLDKENILFLIDKIEFKIHDIV